MKQIVSRWLLPMVLAFGLAGTAAANETKTFSNFFLDDAGQTFGRLFDFKIKGVSNLITLKVASFGLSNNLDISIFDKKSDLRVYQTSFNDMLSDTFALNPGKYSFSFGGTVSSNLAGYAGALSAAPVPEPAEWMMILAGVAMMGVVVSRRRSNG